MIKLIKGDSFELIKKIKSNSIDLVVTDVPYPDFEIHDKEKHIVSSDNWISWFEPMQLEIQRVLKVGGSFVTTINSKNNPEIYFKWINWVQENFDMKYVKNWAWIKKTAMPHKAKSPYNYFDFIAHFVKSYETNISNIYQMQNIENWQKYNPYTKLPTNIIYATSLSEKHYMKISKELDSKHPGKYPSLIPELFIKLLTKENDIILEPFNGSGTTSIIAEQLNRNCIAFEYNNKWIKLAQKQYEELKLNYKISKNYLQN